MLLPLLALPGCLPCAAQRTDEEAFHKELMRACGDANPIPVFGSPKRQTVKRAYIEVVYNAQTGKMFWYDYAAQVRGATTIIPITQTSPFAPVTFTKEQILVRVCGAKFNSTITITPQTTQVRESTLDIRGVTASPGSTQGSTPTSPTSSTAPSGPAAAAAAAAAPTPTTLIAQRAAFYYQSYRALRRSIELVSCPANDSTCAADTVPAIEREVRALLTALAYPDYENQGMYDTLFSQIQKVVTDLTNLGSTLSSVDFVTVAVQLNTLYTSVSTAYSVLNPANPADMATINAINAQIPTFLGSLPGTPPDVATILMNTPGQLYAEITSLSTMLDTLHRDASEVFTRMNTLHDRSRISATNIVTMPTSNADLSISVSVQDNYTPFGFTAAPVPPGATATVRCVDVNAPLDMNPHRWLGT
jgi:hypothetical protein